MCERLVIDDLVHWARSYKVCMLEKSPTAALAVHQGMWGLAPLQQAYSDEYSLQPG